MEKINVNLYGGKGLLGGKETPLEAEEIFCERPNECTFYKEGKCLRCRSFMAPWNCPFGKVNTIKGYTSRAAKYYNFKKKYTDDPVYSNLKYPSDYVAVMGDTLYIYTQYVDVRKRNEKDEKWRKDINGYIIDNCGFGCNYVFMPLKDATNGLLYEIFSYRPTALMGGAIADWPKKRVPEILLGLKKYAPEIYSRFIGEYPEFVYEPDYVGKRAYVDSLKPGTVFTIKGVKWVFDGEYVFSLQEIDIGSGSPWWLQDGTKTSVKIKANPKMTFEVTDNSIIDDDVRFE